MIRATSERLNMWFVHVCMTVGHREAEQQQQQQGNRAPPQPAERQYHSYTYAAGPSGRSTVVKNM